MKNKALLSLSQLLMIGILPPVITEILVFSGIQRSFWLHLFSYIAIIILAFLYNYLRKKSDHTT